MTKPPSSLVLQLELENLKEHMSSVQAEVGRFVTSLMVQSQDVCEVLARIEIVTAMVRAGQTIVREKWAEEEVSFPNSTLGKLADNYDSATAEDISELHHPIAKQSDIKYRNEGCNETC